MEGLVGQGAEVERGEPEPEDSEEEDEDRGSVVHSNFVAPSPATYLSQVPPIHLGPVTAPDPKQLYLYFVLENWQLESRIQADVLGLVLLSELSKNLAVRTAANHQIAGDVQLEVAWCTHKYRLDEDGERQEAKGSGARTHFYLVAVWSSQGSEPETEPACRR